jgi:2-oxoisovalerate dehydrogenase E1 component beta subunit
MATEHMTAEAQQQPKQVTFLEAIRDALRDEMRRDPSVFLLGEDIGAYGGAFKVTEGLLDEFGAARVVDTPISEAAIVGAAAGAAMMGFRPVAEMQFIDFISCAFDQLTNVVSKWRYRMGYGVPIVVRGPCGGGVRGGPFHSGNPESFFANSAGLKIVEPSTAYDAKGLLKAAIRDPDPVLFFEHKLLYRLPRLRESLPDDDYVVSIGSAAVRREGTDVTVVTFGAMVYRALDAAERLAGEGVSVEVVDLRTIVPLDVETIVASIRKTGRAIVLHEASRTGGIGGEVAATVVERAFEWLDAPIVRIASLDTPVPYSPPLEDFFMPQVEDIIEAARKLAAY